MVGKGTSTEGDLHCGSTLLFASIIGSCALIFVSGLSIGTAESLIASKGLKNISLYSDKISGLTLVVAGYFPWPLQSVSRVL